MDCYEYAVQFIDKPRSDDGSVNLGDIDLGEGRIRIERSLTDAVMSQIIIHECLHHYSWSRGIGLSEDQTQALSSALLDLMSQNADLIKDIVAVGSAERRLSLTILEEIN
jgi:hypothetical protein